MCYHDLFPYVVVMLRRINSKGRYDNDFVLATHDIRDDAAATKTSQYSLTIHDARR